MDVIAGLSASGAILGALAAWAGLFSPKARAARQNRADRCQREREVHTALFGVPARIDDSGALIAHAEPGLLADMRVVMAKLNAPLLNGKGDDLIATVDRLDKSMGRLDRRTREQSKRLVDLERQLTEDPS